jgi:small multidrug resistance pump
LCGGGKIDQSYCKLIFPALKSHVKDELSWLFNDNLFPARHTVEQVNLWKKKTMSGFMYLAMAIVAEVVATTMLKASEGFTRLWPSLVVVVGYAVAFWGLSMVVKTMPLGIVYAIWSGMGIVLVSIAAVFVYQQKLDLPAVFGMGLIIAGVLVINLLSKTAAH